MGQVELADDIEAAHRVADDRVLMATPVLCGRAHGPEGYQKSRRKFCYRERVDNLGEVLLSSQWWALLSTKDWRPEARLFAEILRLAIEDATVHPPYSADPSHHRKWRQRRDDARRWFEGDEGVVSFATCCDVLDIDASAARFHLVGALEPATAATG